MSVNFSLEGKIAFVTGASYGIGFAIASGMAKAGAKIVFNDIKQELVDKGLAAYKEAGIDAHGYVCDVTNEEAVNATVEKITKEVGPIDILVNNAGINIPRLLVDKDDPYGKYELDENVFDKVSAVNIKGVYLCAQALGHEFVKNGEGVIINMSSESGLEGSEGQSIYAATKNAVNSFTRSWAKELGKHHVRVVGVAPGILEATGLRTLAYEESLAYTRGITVEQLRAGYTNTKTTPLGRDGKLTEVADMVMFLSSHRASYVHGVTFNVAGGKTRG